jgi:hypothetical protein
MTATVADVEAVLAECRALRAAGYRVMFHTGLDVRGRQVAMLRLLNRARASAAPELACRAVERVVFDFVFGRPQDADLWDSLIEQVYQRDARRSA